MTADDVAITGYVCFFFCVFAAWFEMEDTVRLIGFLIAAFAMLMLGMSLMPVHEILGLTR